METDTKKQISNARLTNPDFLKSIAIFFVVFVHGSSIFPYVRSNIIDTLSSLVRICVPLFILLWSFFIKKGFNKHYEARVYLKNKLNKLLPPFFFWSIVYFFILADFTNTNFVKFFTKHFTGRGWSGQYYFIILFQLIPLVFLIDKLSFYIKKNLLIFTLLSILFYTYIAYSSIYTIRIIDKIGDELFLYWIPYVMIGILLTYKDVANKFRVSLWIGILSLMLIPIEFHFLNPLSKPYLTPTIFVASVLFFTAVMNYKLPVVFDNSHVKSFLAYISNNTLGIFCINPLVILCLVPIIKNDPLLLDFWGCSIITPVLSTLFIISICLIIIKFFQKIKLGFLVSN